jgi:hypothetical protein
MFDQNEWQLADSSSVSYMGKRRNELWANEIKNMVKIIGKQRGWLTENFSIMEKFVSSMKTPTFIILSSVQNF